MRWVERNLVARYAWSMAFHLKESKLLEKEKESARKAEREKERERWEGEGDGWSDASNQKQDDSQYMNTICGCDCANEFCKIDRLVVDFQIYLIVHLIVNSSTTYKFWKFHVFFNLYESLSILNSSYSLPTLRFLYTFAFEKRSFKSIKF